jgi:phage gpG-like protein
VLLRGLIDYLLLIVIEYKMKGKLNRHRTRKSARLNAATVNDATESTNVENRHTTTDATTTAETDVPTKVATEVPTEAAIDLSEEEAAAKDEAAKAILQISKQIDKSSNTDDSASSDTDDSASSGTDEGYASKHEFFPFIRNFHEKWHSSDMTFLFLTPTGWIDLYYQLEDDAGMETCVVQSLADVLHRASETNIDLFRASDFKDWDPRKHGPTNVYQSFYIASLISTKRLKFADHMDERSSTAKMLRSNSDSSDNFDDAPEEIEIEPAISIDRPRNAHDRFCLH